MREEKYRKKKSTVEMTLKRLFISSNNEKKNLRIKRMKKNARENLNERRTKIQKNGKLRKIHTNILTESHWPRYFPVYHLL